MPTAVPQSRPKYKTPPLVEVAATLGFETIDPTKLVLSVHDFYSKLGPGYELQLKNEVPEIRGVHIQQVDEHSNLTTPKFWLVHENTTDLIQISNRRLSFNWRKLKSDTDIKYKTYEHVWQQFSAGIKTLNQVLPTRVNPKNLELAYYSHIRMSDFGGAVKDIHRVFPALNWFPNTPWLAEPNAFNFVWNIPDLDSGKNVTVQVVTAVDSNTGEDILRLEIVVKKNVHEDKLDSEDEIVEKWFQEAHFTIVNTFAAITSEQIQKEKWGREDV